eukprot:CAMPEP_0177653110 /NCGR_PEP_ID=MMETSP0447-20121125/13534_1 /TAXON_ID=0 /ORGANISM="Stygamoeba regulata, Strain BSH-02190019" /LENGTH=345 /DNA_ID=CAMNT_0019156491 /DNA_START=59 /DNA_END=1096 /DNA_ORIENTATION=-
MSVSQDVIEQVEGVRITFGVTGLISLVTGSSFLLFLLVKMVKEFVSANAEDMPTITIKNFSRILLCNLLLADCISSLFYVFTFFEAPQYKSNVCQLEGGMISFSTLASILLTCMLSYSIFFFLSINTQVRFSTRNELARFMQRMVMTMCAVSWLIPFAVSLSLYFFNVYGMAGYWCWITSSHVAVRVALFFLPLLLAFAFNVTIMVLLILRVSLANHRNLVMDLLWYIPAFMAVWTFPIICIIYEYANGSAPTWLWYMRALTEPLQGFANTLVWGVQKIYGHRLAQFFRSYICRGACASSAEDHILFTDEESFRDTTGLLDADTSTVDVLGKHVDLPDRIDSETL